MTATLTAFLALRTRAWLLLVVVLDLLHPLFHPFEGGSFDQILVWLNATAAEAVG